MLVDFYLISTENAAIITIKLLTFFHIFSNVVIGSENTPSLNLIIIECYVILLISTRPLITINKQGIQRFCLSCLELNAVSIILGFHQSCDQN